MPTIRLNVTKDSYLQQNAATTVRGGGVAVWFGEGNHESSAARRMLLHFDFSVIPAGATITSATLYLRHYDSSYADNARTFHVYRVVRAWVENQATWNEAATGTNWGTAGCGNTTTDYDNTSLGSRAFSASEAAGWKTWALTASVMQDIFDGAVTYEGFLLRSSTELNDAQTFRAKEYGASIPFIDVVYELPPPELQVVMI
jgi:hypothetical protein